MKIFEQIEKLQKINLLIENGTSGNAIKFAEKLGISRSHLFNYFEELKALGIDVKFDKKNGTYRFKNKIKVAIEHPVKVQTLK